MNTQEKRYPRYAMCLTDEGRLRYIVQQPAPLRRWRIVKYHPGVNLEGPKPDDWWEGDNGYELINEGEWFRCDELDSSFPEKNGELTQRCPMDTCLAPQRLKVLEDFYKEVCRIQNEESGNMRVGLALSRAIAKVHNNE